MKPYLIFAGGILAALVGLGLWQLHTDHTTLGQTVGWINDVEQGYHLRARLLQKEQPPIAAAQPSTTPSTTPAPKR